MALRVEWSPAATRILDAADRLLVRYGYRKMTVDDLAREVGRAAGAFAVAEPAAAARAFVTATNALLPYSLSVEELGQRAEIQHRADDIARLLVRGIAAAPRHPHRTRSTPPTRTRIAR